MSSSIFPRGKVVCYNGTVSPRRGGKERVMHVITEEELKAIEDSPESRRLVENTRMVPGLRIKVEIVDLPHWGDVIIEGEEAALKVFNKRVRVLPQPKQP